MGAAEGDETLEDELGPYASLVEVYERLEAHYRDMQDLEFTIQEGRLWMLQTRNGKRTPGPRSGSLSTWQMKD